MLKVLLGIGLALIALGVALIPLPGPGFIVLTLGVIVTAVAAGLLQQRPRRSGREGQVRERRPTAQQ